MINWFFKQRMKMKSRNLISSSFFHNKVHCLIANHFIIKVCTRDPIYGLFYYKTSRVNLSFWTIENEDVRRWEDNSNKFDGANNLDKCLKDNLWIIGFPLTGLYSKGSQGEWKNIFFYLNELSQGKSFNSEKSSKYFKYFLKIYWRFAVGHESKPSDLELRYKAVGLIPSLASNFLTLLKKKSTRHPESV